MKVLLLNGSPNEHGCTYTALCEVARALDGRAAGHADGHPHLRCNYVCKGGFAKSRGTVQQNVVKAFAACKGSLDVNAHIFLHFVLSDVVVKGFGAKNIFRVTLVFRKRACKKLIFHFCLPIDTVICRKRKLHSERHVDDFFRGGCAQFDHRFDEFFRVHRRFAQRTQNSHRFLSVG